MKALVLVGKDEALAYQDRTMPVHTEGGVLVKLAAAALNHRDVFIKKGLYAGLKYPTILGSDGAGTTEKGKEVIINPLINWGDDPRVQSKNYRILGLPDDGTFAEYIVVETQYLNPKPEHLTFEQAAAVPLAGLTAYRALFSRCQAQEGNRILITGIGGGVALFALQFAVACGLETWVTSSSNEKIQKAMRLGAKGGFNYRTEGWTQTAFTEADGFDCIVDGASGSGFSDLIKVAKPAARLCIYGGTGGPLSGISPQSIFYKQLIIMGSTMGSPQEFEAMLQLIDKHKIVPVIDEVFVLSDGNAAFKKMDEGKQFGKLVLSMGL